MPDPTDPHPVADDPSGIVQQMPEGGDEGLAPCPFCGGRARTEGGIGDVLVECQKCGVCTTYEDSDVIAIAAWNRRADRAAPEGQVRAVIDAAVAWWEGRVPRDLTESYLCDAIAALTPPPAAQEPVAWLIEENGEGVSIFTRDSSLAGARRSSPDFTVTPIYAAPPPACQQEAVTVAEASHRLIVGFMLDCNVIGHVAAAENLVRGIKDHVAALRTLKGEQK